MKKFWLLCSLCCVCFSGFGQGTTPPPPLPPGSYLSGEQILDHIYSMDMNYHHIAQYAKIYTDSIPNDTSFAKQYGRWSGFWNSRVDASGDFDATYRNMMSVLDNFPVCGGDDADWSQAGPIINVQNSGIIVTVASPPGQPNVIYAGSNSGGLWKTENASRGVNTTWTNITDYRGVPGLGVNDIIIHPTDPSILYIATGFNNRFIPQNYGSGVWISTNSGGTWEETDLTWDPLTTTKARDRLAFNKLAFHPTNPNIIFALSDKEVYRMERLIDPDDGSTAGWIKTNISYSSRQGKYIDIEFVKTGAQPDDFDTYVSTTLKGQLLRSSDDGDTWFDITTNIPSPPTAPSPHNNSINTIVIESASKDYSNNNNINNSQNLYVYYLYIYNGDYIASLYKHNPANTANPWIMLNNGLNDGQGGTNDGISSGTNWIQPERTFNNFEVNPKDATVMYFPGQKLGKTNNEGIDIDIIEGALSWANSNIHGDHRDLLINFLPNNSYEIVVGNDGGVSTATPNTTTNYTYTNINGEGEVKDRLILSQCTDISISNNITGIDKVILGGAIDNANYLKSSSNFLWENIGNVDGGQTAINETHGLLYIRKNGPVLIYNINPLTVRSSVWIWGNEYDDLAEIEVDRNDPDYFRIAKAQSIRTFKIDPTNNNYQPNTQYSFSFQASPDFDLIQGTNTKLPSISCFKSAHKYPNNMLLAFNEGTYHWDQANGTGWDEPRLFKSSDGGGSWTPVPFFTVAVNGGNINPIGRNYITDICYAPNNDNLVWASMSGWANDPNLNNTNYYPRVIHSTDGGDTWQDYSIGLSDAPVNALAYQEGSNGVLFAATDVGVYRYNPDINEWECFNQGFPVSLVNDLEISNCEQKIYASAYGRGIWESSIPPATGRKTISNNTTWDTDRNVMATTVVETGKTLTIENCTVNIGRGMSIIVEPGAKLIIHNATLTNTCGEMWDGIIVQGDATASQSNSAQGTLITRVNSQIEYAKNAIRVWDPIDGGGISKTGGIINCTQTTFLNNNRDVEFMKYDLGVRNRSTFVRCTFKVDDDYRGTFEDLDDRVTMWHVNGIKYSGCSFEMWNGTLDGIYNRAGIFSIDAGYDVGASCDVSVQRPNPCPEGQINRALFRNFNYGIHALTSHTNHTIRVNKTDFRKNIYGISVKEMDNIQVTECDFHVYGSTPYQGNTINFGVHISSGIGYEVQENIFTGTGDFDVPYSTGVFIYNTENHENKIYKNDFSGLFTANVALGDNGGSSTLGLDGLQYLCNTQSFNNYDIQVIDGPGIRPYQGEPANLLLGTNARPDGNNFSTTNNPSSPLDYNYNMATALNHVFRYYKPGNTPLATYTTSNVNQYNPPNTDDNTCLSELHELDEITIVAGRAGLINDYTVYEAAYNNTVYLYDNLMDGGDPQGLSNDVQFNWSNDAWQMRNELLAESPNLSEEILLDAAFTGTLPDALLMEVLLANPRSVRSREFHEVLLNEIPNPLPQYMVDLLPFAAESPSVRANLEEQMVVYNEKKASAVQLLVHYALRDSIIQLDTVKYWLERDNTPKGRFALAEHYLARGQYTLAQTTVNNVATEFEDYFERYSTEYQGYQQLMTLKVNILQNGRTWLDITESEKGQLQTIAYNSSADAAFQARNILCFFFDECVEEVVDLSNTTSSARIIQVEDAMLELTQSLTNLNVYPNPATDYVTFDYELPEYVEQSTIIITSITGKVVKEININDTKGQVLWDTRTIENGIYFYALKQGDKTLTSGKVSIMK